MNRVIKRSWLMAGIVLFGTVVMAAAPAEASGRHHRRPTCNSWGYSGGHGYRHYRPSRHVYVRPHINRHHQYRRPYRSYSVRSHYRAPSYRSHYRSRSYRYRYCY